MRLPKIRKIKLFIRLSFQKQIKNCSVPGGIYNWCQYRIKCLATSILTGCIDKTVTAYCRIWAEKSYCTKKYKIYMIKNCKRSCGCCTPIQNVSPFYKRYCKLYATKNSCGKYRWVKKICKAVCDCLLQRTSKDRMKDISWVS